MVKHGFFFIQYLAPFPCWKSDRCSSTSRTRNWAFVHSTHSINSLNILLLLFTYNAKIRHAFAFTIKYCLHKYPSEKKIFRFDKWGGRLLCLFPLKINKIDSAKIGIRADIFTGSIIFHLNWKKWNKI